MQVDVARAQAETLDEWSVNWDRESAGDAQSGASEVAFLLQRAARMIRRTLGDTGSVEPAMKFGDDAALSEPVLATEPRPD